MLLFRMFSKRENRCLKEGKNQLSGGTKVVRYGTMCYDFGSDSQSESGCRLQLLRWVRAESGSALFYGCAYITDGCK